MITDWFSEYNICTARIYAMEHPEKHNEQNLASSQRKRDAIRDRKNRLAMEQDIKTGEALRNIREHFSEHVHKSTIQERNGCAPHSPYNQK